MDNMLDIARQASEDEALLRLSAVLHESHAATKRGIDSAVPTSIAGLAEHARSERNAEQLLSAFRDGDYPHVAPAELRALVQDPLSTVRMAASGEGFLARIFGNKLDQVVDLVAHQAGVNRTSAHVLLGLSAPLVLDALRKEAESRHLDAAGLSHFLLEQEERAARALPSELASAVATGARGLRAVEPARAAGARRGAKVTYLRERPRRQRAQEPEQARAATREEAPIAERATPGRRWIVAGLVLMALLAWLLSRLPPTEVPKPRLPRPAQGSAPTAVPPEQRFATRAAEQALPYGSAVPVELVERSEVAARAQDEDTDEPVSSNTNEAADRAPAEAASASRARPSDRSAAHRAPSDAPSTRRERGATNADWSAPLSLPGTRSANAEASDEPAALDVPIAPDHATEMVIRAMMERDLAEAKQREAPPQLVEGPAPLSARTQKLGALTPQGLDRVRAAKEATAPVDGIAESRPTRPLPAAALTEIGSFLESGAVPPRRFTLQGVRFAEGTSEFEALPGALAAAAREIAAHPGVRVMVYGPTDGPGTDATLSAARALRLKAYLVEHGVPEERVDVAPRARMDHLTQAELVVLTR